MIWLFAVCVILSCGPLTAQVYRAVAEPPAVLPSPLRVQTPHHQFDAFAQPLEENTNVHPWQTLDIPPGSWGDLNMWDSRQLQATTIKRFRKSFVQKIEINSSYIHRDGVDNLGYTSADVGITMVVPLGNIDNLLVLTPRYEADWVDGPGFIDVPSYLQAAVLDIGWRKVFNDRWSLIAGVQPGFFNDRLAEENAFRLGGLAVVTCQMIPEVLAVTLGLAYLDQADFNVVPAVGVTWVPNPDTRFDLNFPKPKIGYRVSHIPFLLEDWVYLAGSFGGGTWAVRRTSGQDDVLNLRDFRIATGFERVLNGGTGFNVELGYVFSRRLDYVSNPNRIHFANSFVIEAGMRF